MNIPKGILLATLGFFYILLMNFPFLESLGPPSWRGVRALMRAHEQSRSPVPKVGDKVETYMANLLNIDIEANLTIAIDWKKFICAKPVEAKRERLALQLNMNRIQAKYLGCFQFGGM